MAKAGKSVRRSAVSADKWLTCTGYQISVDNSRSSFILQLVARANNRDYYLRINDPNMKVGTVQKVLRVIADRWPAYAFEFKADASRNIIDAQ